MGAADGQGRTEAPTMALTKHGLTGDKNVERISVSARVAGKNSNSSGHSLAPN